MNLREDKHWSYGASSMILPAKAQRMYFLYSSVQSDKTADAMQEVRKELQGIAGDKPPTEEEFVKTQSNVVRGLPGSWETIGQVAGSVEEIVQYNLPDDYYQQYPAKIANMTVQEVRQAAAQAVKPASLVWVVVGEKAKIDDSIKALGLPVTYMDADGNRL
jgi:predicted Zn-dependent peptidase